MAKATGFGGMRVVDSMKVHKHGDAFLRDMRDRLGPRVILAFSSGKDAVATALRMKPYFDEIVPYCAYYCPGLKIMDEALKYYEDTIFGRSIIRAPHPWFVNALQSLMYQDPKSAMLIGNYDFPPDYSHDHIIRWVIASEGLPEGQLCATGSRAGEMMHRGARAAKTGGVQANINQWWPIWEWSKADVFEQISKSGLKLSREYELFNASLAGFNYSYLYALEREEPEDFARVVAWFPLIGAEILRFERAKSEAKNVAPA